MPEAIHEKHCREWPSMAALREWVEGLGLMDYELVDFDGLMADVEEDVEGMRRRYANKVRIAEAGYGNALSIDLTDEYLEWLGFSADGKRQPDVPDARPEERTGNSRMAGR